MTVKKIKIKGQDATVADLPGGGKKVWTEDGTIHILGPEVKKEPAATKAVRPFRAETSRRG